MPKPVLWANQSAWRKAVTDIKLAFVCAARHCTDAARTARLPPAEAMPTTDATTRWVDMRRRSSSLVAMTREALLLATLGVLTLSFVQSDSTPSEPSCVRSTTDAGSGSCPSDTKFARIVAIPDIHGDYDLMLNTATTAAGRLL